MTEPLPFVDARTVEVDASADAVWEALLRVVDRSFSGAHGARFARPVGCTDVLASGPRPLAVGSTIVGFRVVTATPPAELVLEGAHRFSTYRLVFRVESRDGSRSTLRAET